MSRIKYILLNKIHPYKLTCLLVCRYKRTCAIWNQMLVHYTGLVFPMHGQQNTKTHFY